MEQKWPDTIVIVRHGESERNAARERAESGMGHSTYGSGLRDVDTPLTEKGREQARLTGRYLAQNYRFDSIYTSPYLRTLQTTREIAAGLPPGVRVKHEERLREIEFGVLDGFTSEGIQQNFPLEHARREREGKYWYRPPGGESRPDVALRVHSFLGTLTRECRCQTVLIVCHSVVVLVFRRLIERWDEDTYLEINRESDVMNCSITSYRFDPGAGRLQLDCFNKIVY